MSVNGSFKDKHPTFVTFLQSITLGRTLGSAIAFAVGLLFTAIQQENTTTFIMVAIALAELFSIDVVVFLLGMQLQGVANEG